MRSRTRNLIVFIVVAVVIAAIALAVYLRKRAAPEPARLLPESDAVVYFNLKTVRRLTSLGDKPVAPTDPGYSEFVKETGFQFERDLDEAAFAVHAVRVASSSGPPSIEHRFSEVFIGKIDGQRLAAYLAKIAKGMARYHEINIYSVPVEDRTVRVAILGVDTVAASNVDDPEVIRGIIDRFRSSAAPFGGPSLVRDFYRKIPFGSLAWGIVRIPAKPANPREGRAITLPGGIDAFIANQTTVIASLRYLGSIHARADFLTQSDADAKQLVDQAQTFLQLFQAVQQSEPVGGTDPDVKAAFDSLKIEQDGDIARITATIPTGFLQKLVEEPAIDLTGTQTPKAPEELPKATEKKSGGAKKK